MRTFKLDHEFTLPRPRDEVFPFFAAAENLEEITPPWLKFSVLTETPVDMKTGARIDYRLRIRGIPIQWQSEITAWEPPGRFVDEQRRGPYRLWVHEHTFTESPDGQSTIVGDHVEYAPLGGALVNRFLVRPDLERIFAYREKRLREVFGAPVEAASS